MAGLGAISGDGACSTGSTPVFQNLHFRRKTKLLFVRFGFSSLYLKSLFELLELRHDSLESFGLQDRPSRIFMGASWICHRILPSFRPPRWCWGGREWRVLVPFPGMVPFPPAPLQCSKIYVFDENVFFGKLWGLKSLFELAGNPSPRYVGSGRGWRVLVPFPGMVPAPPAPLQCSQNCICP